MDGRISKEFMDDWWYKKSLGTMYTKKEISGITHNFNFLLS